MAKKFSLGSFEVHWLPGGEFELDGGCMFGVVPRVLWQKKFPVQADGYVRLTAAPILIRTPQGNVVIETGLGNKLTEKQKKIFRITREWDVTAALTKLGLSRHDIDHVILTHCDFDHSGGLVMLNDAGTPELTFPQAQYHVQRREWEDVLAPNIRAVNTYWPANLALLQESAKLRLVDGIAPVVDGISLELTGGHSRGHQIVWLESEGARAVHMGDLVPNHAFGNPLWITPYDNFPLDSVHSKAELMKRAQDEKRWFVFYHDPFLAACRFDADGNVTDSLPAD